MVRVDRLLGNKCNMIHNVSDKNETTRFLGDGVSFKAKLIGILEVSEARGDRMCQEALSDLKMAIRAAGEHKQRITINIAIDGLRLRDEKTGDSLYHHPVHKISFIAQDMTDSRAFGYIFGSPDTGHRFFGIKTDKAASQVVIAMRDLFQVVFALKKKEIELAKQHLEKTCYPPSPLFSDSSSSSSKLQSVPHVSIKSTTETKTTSGSASDPKTSGTAVADLVDLELELNSLQQGLNQMERITPSDPFGTKDDPFGDSFISYPAKPILPPPPPSNRERSNRTSDSGSSSIFSPKRAHAVVALDSASSTKKEFSFPRDFDSSREEPSSGDWFSAPGSIFEERSPLSVVPPALEKTKDEKHEQAKQEILSQFDVFTELDPLELKNPPKKPLKELAGSNPAPLVADPSAFQAGYQSLPTQHAIPPSAIPSQEVFTVDPFGEDPFVKEDPFADSDFSKQDPFETEFANFSSNQNSLDQFKFKDALQNVLSKSPLDKPSVLLSSSPKFISSNFPKSVNFNEQKLSQLHDNPSLDVSSEGECAPEPPPRPFSTSMQVKPPPLPPKKLGIEIVTGKPPPRPMYHTAHDDLSPYEIVERYGLVSEVGLDFGRSSIDEKSPPLPVPSRKAKFDADITLGSAPERPKKQFNISSSEEDYLTPISFPEKDSILPPPPQKNILRPAGESRSCDSLEGLDITLSQLTLTGLNELAQKLNIPAGQLSNMTLVQLTNFLSNFIKSSNSIPANKYNESTMTNSNEFPSFQADFAANFNNFNAGNESSYDRYAVFRELMQEEIKQTKIDSEPEEILEEKEKLENSVNSNVNLNLKPLCDEPSTDKYAALREIVEIELKQSEIARDEANQNQSQNEIDDIAEEEEEEEHPENIVNGDIVETEINIINKEKIFADNMEAIISPMKSNIMEYSIQLDDKDMKVITPSKSPAKSPVKLTPTKSPIPSVITDGVHNNTRQTSCSISDIISGSSPEIDNTASNSDIGKKTTDVTGESWAIFDQTTAPSESLKERQMAQSEEGASPWSSDSKEEFGNGTLPQWQGKGTEQWSKRRRDQDGWWDTSAEPEVNYCPPNRRSTDSYDEEYHECYDERPLQHRRRRQPSNWKTGRGGAQTGGGHSSSSRDVSPWEEEPRKPRIGATHGGRGRQHLPPRMGHQYDRRRRVTDSWDEDDDDYEYDEDDQDSRFHWSDRHGPRDVDRESRYSTSSRDHDSSDRWCDDRRHRRRRELRERWCCPDWEQAEYEKSSRYSSTAGRWQNPETAPPIGVNKRRDEYHYSGGSREPQESPWEDEYIESEDNPPPTHYPKRTGTGWKQRPSSATDAERKAASIEGKGRHYMMGTGGSDGERDRRYKPAKRSRSRDSQYSDPQHRHKPDLGVPTRIVHRIKPHPKPLDNDFLDAPAKKMESKDSNKKSSTLSRKKVKDGPKLEEVSSGTFPRKSSSRGKSLFDNDFAIPTEGCTLRLGGKLNFEDLETSEAESPTVTRPPKAVRQQTMFEKGAVMVERDYKEQKGGSLRESKLSPRYQTKSKSLFEDDFSPSEKSETVPDDSISSIKEEIDREEDDEFGATNLENASNGRRRILSKNRLSTGNSRQVDANLKKSESVNIFAREDDPFDDDFFSGEQAAGNEDRPARNSELRWTEDFDN